MIIREIVEQVANRIKRKMLTFQSPEIELCEKEFNRKPNGPTTVHINTSPAHSMNLEPGEGISSYTAEPGLKLSAARKDSRFKISEKLKLTHKTKICLRNSLTKTSSNKIEDFVFSTVGTSKNLPREDSCSSSCM